ncbi:simple sugar transport system permease protein [Nakamurella sp. UYEF19]|uniref:ABC transporter permease n=1 Tax=Nakamurella sp. UYEF19 TaxID=1756392 RepID=UPI00339ACEEB
MTAGTTPATTVGRDRPAPSIVDFVVKYGVLLIFAVVLIVFSLVIDDFASMNTVTSILQAQTVAGIAALGMTLTAVVGDLDLSVGGIAGLSVTVAALAMIRYALTGGTAIVICLLAGLAAGCVNASLIVFLKIPPLLATLGTMFTAQGLKRWLVDGQTLVSGMTLPGSDQPMKGKFTDDFAAIDGSRLFGLPYSVYLFLILALVMWVFLERTRFGRLFYAVGGNPEAARLAGTRIQRYRFAAYAISGVLASIAGIILASRLRQGDVTAGDSTLLDAVAITLVGYAVLGARKPNAFGTFIGALFIGVVLYGLTRLQMSYYTQDLIKGLVLIFALMVSFSLRRRRRKAAASIPVVPGPEVAR